MNAISLNRLKYLFIEYFVLYWKRDLIIFGSLFLAKITFTLDHQWFPDTLAILFAAIILSSISYSSSLSTKLQRANYLICPANTEEKVLANIVLVHIYYTVLLVFTYLLGNLIKRNLLGTFYTGLDPFTFSTMKDFLDYRFYLTLFVFQSFFMFASVYFRKKALLKTLLFFAVLVTIYVSFITSTGIGMITVVTEQYTFSKDVISYVISEYLDKDISYYIVIVLFWFLSYLRLKRTEV